MNYRAVCKNGVLIIDMDTAVKVCEDNSTKIKEILELENEIELLEQEKQELLEDINYKYGFLTKFLALISLILGVAFLTIDFSLFIKAFNIIDKIIFALIAIPFLHFSKKDLDFLLTSKNSRKISVDFIDNDIEKIKKRIEELKSQKSYKIYQENDYIILKINYEKVQDKIELYRDYPDNKKEYQKGVIDDSLYEELLDCDFSKEAIEDFYDNIKEDIKRKKTKSLGRRK